MFGVTAPRPGGHDLADTRLPGVVQGQRVHHQVLVEEVRGPSLVGGDPADQSRHVQEHVHAVLLEQPLDVVGLAQVEVAMGHDMELGTARQP